MFNEKIDLKKKVLFKKKKERKKERKKETKKERGKHIDRWLIALHKIKTLSFHL